jgi:branched-chain amino acid aminotransferase
MTGGKLLVGVSRMAKGFTLEVNPWVYLARFEEGNGWEESYRERPHLSPAEEAKLPFDEKAKLLSQRNSPGELPLVNYSTQYGFSCFEGLKAFPQKNGSLKVFRPIENGKRLAKSMEGLCMPAFPPEKFVESVAKVVALNRKIGFTAEYDPEWEKDDFVAGHSVYIRPFTYSEPGIGLNLSEKPWVIVITTNVGAYFLPGNAKAKTTDKIRAFPGGTGWIKCSANYVTPTLVKKAAMAEGFMEAIFLDAVHHKYIEEGSSCNIFFLLRNDTLVTPELGDTVLPGITRSSVLQLADGMGFRTEERKITIDEAMSESKEVFVAGTAAGISYIESLTHNGRTVVFGDGTMGDATQTFLRNLKGIQYGAKEDLYGWMVNVDESEDG